MKTEGKPSRVTPVVSATLRTTVREPLG